jgi:hypothetical protein
VNKVWSAAFRRKNELMQDRLEAERQRRDDMKSLAEVAASLLLALIMLRASGSLFGIIYEWKLRAGKF